MGFGPGFLLYEVLNGLVAYSFLEALESKQFPFLELNSDVYFGDLADQMRRIRILTIFASIMLPLTVITGFYGMNVDLPLDGFTWAYGVILGVMGAFVAGLLLFLVRHRWT